MTSIFESPSTRIFLAVSTLCSIWIIFGNDYSQVRLQSPISLGTARSEIMVAKLDTDDKPEKYLLPETKNDAAPMVDIPPADVKEYIKKFAGLAIEEMRRTGIPASVSMAQGIVESRAGRSGLALTANNHFGIKCAVKGKCPAGHCINFTDDVELDYFVVYQNAYKSWKAHSEFLKKPRYRKCFEQSSYIGWANQLQKAGYATDRTYARKLIKIIETYKLQMLDQ